MAAHSMKPKRLLIASDHAGFELKEALKSACPELPWFDLGPSNADRVDYPDYAGKLARELKADHEMGVLICGSGQGMAIAANRYSHVRAALVWNEEITKLSRGHNDANVLCLGARFLKVEEAKKLLSVFLETPFEGGRHADRVTKLFGGAEGC
jgi:ribose 5-phosphate isomerase B